MEAQGDGVDRATEDLGSCGVAELLPHHEAENLSIEGAESPDGVADSIGERIDRSRRQR